MKPSVVTDSESSHMFRRSLLLTGLLACIATSQNCPAQTSEDRTADRRPNIVFIFCDDLTCQAISAYGENRHLLETPNIDRLAAQGARFDRCLVTNSI